MRRIAVLTLLFLSWSAHTCVAQGVHKSEQSSAYDRRPASDAHSFQELFQKLERQWIDAAQAQNKDSLETILAPEFMYWRSEDPDHPIPRAEWLQQALARADTGHLSPGEMTIRAFVGSAVVSFELTHHAPDAGSDQVARYFIVDLWVVNHGQWQVADRYITTAGKPPCRGN